MPQVFDSALKVSVRSVHLRGLTPAQFGTDPSDDGRAGEESTPTPTPVPACRTCDPAGENASHLPPSSHPEVPEVLQKIGTIRHSD